MAEPSSRLTTPLYLSPFDNPSESLVPYTLQVDGTNYWPWSRIMRTALRAMNKFGFVDGTISRPKEGDPDAGQWDACDAMVTSWIINSLDKDLQDSALFAKSAKALWEDLKTRYYPPDQIRIYQLMTEIRHLKQDGRTVMEYYSALMCLWGELDSLREIPACTCNCGADEKYKALREMEKSHQFLMGLDEKFGRVRSNILITEPMPSLSKIYSRVVYAEQCMQATQI